MICGKKKFGETLNLIGITESNKLAISHQEAAEGNTLVEGEDLTTYFQLLKISDKGKKLSLTEDKIAFFTLKLRKFSTKTSL